MELEDRGAKDAGRGSGDLVSSTEMIIYELLRSSGTKKFKEMLKRLK